ncbi:LytTR family two component transcriptional regulator [Tenacibaculum skagerrakense]|uniref:LytTR family two component transcriptional regulator n=1 Tax=Tenacibaculum skagerrakense TaxID=186571 RepID=A0A4V2SM32_9FLAO|nr:LytTR family DNA-binding domain-containing protein [Tenacibaculum skagerrakense]TCP25706.1 LytTR family two component transcriptional regulator [Tenacibaculum skagerrakense]
MTALIIEDELPSARRLERLLIKNNITVVKSLTSIKSSISWFKNNNHPNLVFLDIQLSDGLCFEIFKKIDIHSNIIFTTAYSDYSIKAFDFNSISYLLKPINDNDLIKTLLKASQICEREENYNNLMKIHSEFTSHKFKTTYTIKFGNKIKIIKDRDIHYFESNDNYTYLNSNSSKGIVNFSLSKLEEILNPFYFFRVNRSIIINKNQIKQVEKYSNSRLKLVLHSYDEQEIIVSRERVKDFKNWIG